MEHLSSSAAILLFVCIFIRLPVQTVSTELSRAPPPVRCRESLPEKLFHVKEWEKPRAYKFIDVSTEREPSAVVVVLLLVLFFYLRR